MDPRGKQPALGPTLALILVAGCLLMPGIAQAAPACTVEGGPRADHLNGTAAADVICGRGGADVIHGRGGKDRLLGGPGPDRLSGGPGEDTLLGGPGKDRLSGGPGTDRLVGGPGRNSCPASARFDRVSRCRVAVRPTPRFQSPCWYRPPPCRLGGYVEPPDTVAPQLYFAGVGPEIADASEGPLALKIYANAMDAGARGWNGSGVASVTARVRGPGGFLVDVPLSPGEEEPTHFQATTLVAAPQPGFYRLESVTVTDVLGNSATHTRTYFAEGLGPGTEVYTGPDEEGPTLLGLTISPLVVDTSDGPATVTVSARVSDPLAGARQVGPGFDLPNREPGILGPGSHRAFMSRTEGDVHDGVWSVQLGLPRHAAPGTYPIERFDLYDRLGEHTLYDREDLEAAGFPACFEVAPPGDSQPPEIAHLGIGRPVLHAADGEDEFVFFLNASDDLSGIAQEEYFSRVEVVFLSPKGRPDWGAAETILRFSGTELDGVWKASGKLGADAPIGTYSVTTVRVSDRAGNVANLEGEELADTGWDLSFENLP
jgi:hypothetical protein